MCFVKIFDRKYELAVTQHGNFIFGKYDDVDYPVNIIMEIGRIFVVLIMFLFYCSQSGRSW